MIIRQDLLDSADQFLTLRGNQWLDTGEAASAEAELAKLRTGAKHAAALGLEVHAGHGLTYNTVKAIPAIPQVVELNIGHFLVGEGIFVGLDRAVAQMRAMMSDARGASVTPIMAEAQPRSVT